MLVMIYPDLIQFIFYVFGFLIVVSYTNWYMIFVVALFIIGFYLMIKFSISTSRELRRIELVTRSPLFSHLSNAIMGIRIIRIYENSERLKQKFFDDCALN